MMGERKEHAAHQEGSWRSQWLQGWVWNSPPIFWGEVTSRAQMQELLASRLILLCQSAGFAKMRDGWRG